MATFTTSISQIESLYVGYFGRAGDPAGANYWVGFLNDQAISLAQAAAAFAVQQEAKTKYPYLAAPAIADPGPFVDQVYQNLFNRAADPAGKAYWVAQLQAAGGNPQAVGQFILNVISGATGSDAAAISNKVAVAQDFTLTASNLGFTWNSSAAGQSSLEIARVNDDPASVTAAKAATVVFFSTAPASQLTFTLQVDSLETTAANANFNAPLIFNPGSGTLLQSLQTGDSAIDTGPGGSLTAVLNSGSNAGPVTLQGIPTASVTSLTNGSGFSGKITGLTTLNNNSSVGSLTLGLAGMGLNTALSTVNINGSGVGAGANTLAIIAASALSGSADAVGVSITGAIGTSDVVVGAAQVVLMNDGPAGATTPMNAYEIETISAANTAFLQLSNAATGVLSTTTLNLKGAGTLQLSAATATDFSNLTKIDASDTTGGVTVTGFTDILDGTGTPFNAGAAGLLAANASLTSFTGGTGADRLDISFMAPGQVSAFTKLSGGDGRDMLVLGADVLNAGVTVPSTGFETIGVAVGLSSTGLMGTTDITKLGANVDTIQLLGVLFDNVGFVNTPSIFNFRADGFVFGVDVTVQGPTGSNDVLNVFDQFVMGRLNVTGYETVNFTTASDEIIRSITVNPTAGFISTLNIINSSANCGCSFNIEIDEQVDVGSGTINISGSGTGGVALIGFVTAGTMNASALNTGAGPDDRGVGMAVGATASINILGSNGSDFLIGSAAADVINGGAGNDIISNTSQPAPAAGDRITGGGGDDIFFVVNNAASAPILTAYNNAPLITDFTASQVPFAGDVIMLAPDSPSYGLTNLQANFSIPGEIPLQATGNSGTAAIIDASSEIVKLTQNTATAGLSLQQAFNAAIGTATITGATTNGEYFFTMFDATNGRMAIGIVDASNGTADVIETGDAVILVGTVTMTSGAYAQLSSNQFAFDFPS
jgi:hypothetical protein